MRLSILILYKTEEEHVHLYSSCKKWLEPFLYLKQNGKKKGEEEREKRTIKGYARPKAPKKKQS